MSVTVVHREVQVDAPQFCSACGRSADPTNRLTRAGKRIVLCCSCTGQRLADLLASLTKDERDAWFDAQPGDAIITEGPVA